MGPVYYFPCHTSNIISSGALKLYVGFQKIKYEPLEHCYFVDPQGISWRSPYQTQNNLGYLQIESVKVNPHRDGNIVVPTVCTLSKQNIYQLIHHHFGHDSITILKLMAIKRLMEGLPENILGLEELCLVCCLTKATNISRGTITDVSEFAPGFMLKMDFSFFSVEIIRRFTSMFMAICSAISYPFWFTYRSKRPPLDILKFLVTTLRNQDKRVAFIRADEYEALARYSELMKTCHNMNIIVQTTCGYESSRNSKSEILNKTLANITISLLLNSIHNQLLWCFA